MNYMYVSATTTQISTRECSFMSMMINVKPPNKILSQKKPVEIKFHKRAIRFNLLPFLGMYNHIQIVQTHTIRSYGVKFKVTSC